MTLERARIAAELHDGLGHALMVALVQVEAARGLVPADPARASEALAAASGVLRSGLRQMRRAVSSLRSVAPPPGLLSEALGILTAENRSGIALELRQEGEERRLPFETVSVLRSACLEGITNVLKHAGARRAELLVRFTARSVHVEVRNDGERCRRRITSSGGGHGVTGIRERAERLGGRCIARSTPNGGFLLSVEVPG